MKMNKKEYSAPELTVVEMERQAVLLDDSFQDGLGLAPTSNDHLA